MSDDLFYPGATLSYSGAWTSIQRTENGWVVSGPTGQEFPPTTQYVFEDGHEQGGDRRSLSLALWQAIEFLQAHGSRYDKERVNIVLEPGDKYEGHTWGEFEGTGEGAAERGDIGLAERP